MPRITCISKVTGYHPTSGNHLVEGQPVELDERDWSGEIMERPDPEWKSPAEREHANQEGAE